MSHHPNESSYSSNVIGSSIPRIFFLLEVNNENSFKEKPFAIKQNKRNTKYNCNLSEFQIASPLLLTIIFRLTMGKYGFSVYIGGISDRVRTGDVEDFLKGYGKILDISLKSKYGEDVQELIIDLKNYSQYFL